MQADESLHPNVNHRKSAALDGDQVPSHDGPPGLETDARSVFRQCLGEVAAAARGKLPDSASRIDKAVGILLNNDCIAHEPCPDDRGLLVCRFTVGSASDAASHIVTHDDNQGWVCDCRDADTRAPQGRCKHILASMMWLKTHALVQERRPQETDCMAAPSEGNHVDSTAPPLPEAPASANVHVAIGGRRVQITLRDQDEDRLLDRLGRLLARFSVESAPEAEPGDDWCTIHRVRMKARANERGTWYSHWLADEDRWCNGKPGHHVTH